MQRLLILTCLALIASRVTCAQSSEDAMTDEEARQLLDEYYNNAANQDAASESSENSLDASGEVSGPSVLVWPSEDGDDEIGQVGGLAVGADGDLHIFHRGARTWMRDSFDDNNVFTKQDEPIKEATHLIVDYATGAIKQRYGANRFFMPHGLTLDKDGNAWLTDVAMHQVFKIAHGSEEPTLVLGEKFVPGNDNKHFCKPTDVAVASNGEFFVADGYCNSRIMKFAADGTFITSFGKASEGSTFPPAEGTFDIPHSLALVEDWNLLCVADRENERIQCFTAGLQGNTAGRVLPAGMPLKSANNLGRVFAIRAHEHELYGVTNMGLSAGANQLFKVDLRNGEATTIAPGLQNPHSLAVADDGAVYVGEIGPNHVLKIE